MQKKYSGGSLMQQPKEFLKRLTARHAPRKPSVDVQASLQYNQSNWFCCEQNSSNEADHNRNAL